MEKSIKGTRTEQNLLKAFAGESQAHQKYRAFAKKAEQDGFASIARLFRLTAEAERLGLKLTTETARSAEAFNDNLTALKASSSSLGIALARDLSLTMIFISHDLSVVHYIADRIAVMRKGRIVEYGEADKVFSSPSHEYTQALLAAVPRL